MVKSASTEHAGEILRDEKPVIYCLEGVWRADEQDWRSHDWSVEPMLRLLEVNDQWPYRHRDVATKAELKYYLHNEWSRCKYGSILYITTHGSPGTIHLNEEDENGVSLSDLASILEKAVDGCEKCHVHFGGCSVVSKEVEDRIREFKVRTGAVGVSGFQSNNIGWTGIKLPGMLAELMLFSALSDVKIDDGRSYPKKIKRIQAAMDERFEDCKLQFV